MMYRFIWLLILAIPAFDTFSQTVIRGKVLDQQTHQPLVYTNIGIRGTPIGTLSNADGTFMLLINEHHERDSVFFSALGYARQSVSIASLLKQTTVYLTEQIILLPSIHVVALKTPSKPTELGNQHINTGWIENDSLYAGGAIALRINVAEQDVELPYYLTKARLRIWKNTFPAFKVRVRLYDVDSLTGLPKNDLLHQSLVLTSTIRQGWLELDLEPYVIMLSQRQLFLAFEWIVSDDDRRWIGKQYQNYKRQNVDRKKLDTVLIDGKRVVQEVWNYQGFLAGTAFGVSYNNAYTSSYFQCYSRKSSFDQWKRATGILTAQLTVSNQPARVKRKSPAKLTGIDNESISSPCQAGDRSCQALKFLQTFQQNNHIPGFQVAVSLNGQTVLSEAVGYADVEKRLPVTSQTQFRLGSVSKALTSAALLKLMDDGRLNLDAPVQKYVPSFPTKPYHITTKQLAGHTAGIRHYRPNDVHDFVRTQHYKTATEALPIFQHDSLLFEPGTQYRYSSYGWNLIGAVIEGASGQSFLNYMNRNVWVPLGMTSTYGDRADSLMPNRSQFYSESGQVAPYEDLSYKYAGGGLLSTADDLVRFGNSFLANTSSDSSLVKLLFTSQTTRDGKPTYYGLGWNIGRDKNGRRIYWHDGDLSGSSAYLLIYPDDKLIVAFLANAPQGITLDAQRLATLFLE